MNAPWKSGMPGNRDPFAAYICDDAALDVLRPVVIELGWQPEKCNKGGLRNAIQSLSVSASPNILLVDLSESGDPLNDINALAEVCEPGTVVIAIGQVNDVRLYRDLLASGIHDYLLKPLSAGSLRDALNQAQAVFTAPRNAEGEGVKRHISTAVVGARGGVGASTLATSLAWQFSEEHKAPTALFDLDVHFGTGALALDLEPGRGLTDAIDNPSRIDGLFIERAMIRANDNLSILSAEAPISQPLMTDGAAFVQLEEEFRQAFEMTVVDLPRNMLINFPHVLADVNLILLTTEMTLASARDTIRILSWLKTNAAHAHIMIIANKVQPGVAEISKADFEASIERKIDFTIPYDVKAAANAAKLGQTFIAANKSSKASGVMKQIAERVMGASEEDLSSLETEKKSLLGGFDLKSLLAKKEKKAAAPEPAE
ncbi:Type II /IV secretion system ATPase TadZ /CpaE, associated with Flp pilus assembly [Altererythrobacter epoxidivorans]|uniref:Type II /IV secretion system ATPase TadZ /CpaE, associated with Flp pilus assembly n=1 Tax=Altererythrobacter epoxidivorans TaxID=361183 RepID=A0A0M4M5C3_9SPHN|nr:pilus assembly protein CpaE [Altererythrobacter epoxidivorans]ALE17215.1 Type II /IV secretion system ATPase TadZ /CpaE, associated with Flp pilus assembly [Altererythrobacter epoxidivorans]